MLHHSLFLWRNSALMNHLNTLMNIQSQTCIKNNTFDIFRVTEVNPSSIGIRCLECCECFFFNENACNTCVWNRTCRRADNSTSWFAADVMKITVCNTRVSSDWKCESFVPDWAHCWTLLLALNTSEICVCFALKV